MLPVPVLLLPRRLRRRGSGVQHATGLKRQLKSSPCPRARAARRAGPRPACPKQLERLKLRLHLPFTCSAAAGPARRGLWPPAAESARPIEPTGRPGQMAARITARTAQARRLVAARVVPGPAAGESESASRPQLPVTLPGPDPARKGAWVARFEPRGRSASGPIGPVRLGSTIRGMDRLSRTNCSQRSVTHLLRPPSALASAPGRPRLNSGTTSYTYHHFADALKLRRTP